MAKNIVIIFLAIISLALAAAEPTNFDYNTHGDDWGKIWPGCAIDKVENNQQSPI